MKKYILIVFTLFALLAINCKEDKKVEVSEGSTQMKEVMAIHDEVMPKMGEIGRLVAALRKKIDTEQGSTADKKAMEDLQEAHKSMMDWMKSIGDRFEPDEIMNGKALSEEKKQWLNEEEEKVKMVAEKINSSISKAEELLGKN